MSVGECSFDSPSMNTSNNCGSDYGGGSDYGNGGFNDYGNGGGNGNGNGNGSGTSDADNSFNGDYMDAGASLGLGNLGSRSHVGDVAAEDVSRFDNAYDTRVPDKQTTPATEYGSIFDPASHTGDKSLNPAEPKEADADLSFTDQIGGFFTGVYEAGKEAVTGTADLVSNAASMTYDVTFGPPVEALELATEYVTGVDIDLPDFAPDTARGYAQVEAAGEVIGAVIDDPGAIYDAIADPIKEDWNAGRKGEAIGRGVAEVVGAFAGAKGLDKAGKLGAVANRVDVPPASRLDTTELPDAQAPAGYTPKTDSHKFGYEAELDLAQDVQNKPGEAVVGYGDKIGTHGSDVNSVKADGAVDMWDSKARTNPTTITQSPTFTDPTRRANALEGTRNDIVNSDLPDNVKSDALNNLDNGNFNTHTVGAGPGAKGQQVTDTYVGGVKQ